MMMMIRMDEGKETSARLKASVPQRKEYSSKHISLWYINIYRHFPFKTRTNKRKIGQAKNKDIKKCAISRNVMKIINQVTLF